MIFFTLKYTNGIDNLESFREMLLEFKDWYSRKPIED